MRTEKMPFFISPAYSVPRITISRASMLIATLVVLVTPGTVTSAGRAPALPLPGLSVELVWSAT